MTNQEAAQVASSVDPTPDAALKRR